jgi:hypothetical protein
VNGTTYSCGNCGRGPGYGTAAGTLQAAPGVVVSTLTVTGICYAGGALDGGFTDVDKFTTPPHTAQEVVIVNEPPTRCDLYASPGP